MRWSAVLMSLLIAGCSAGVLSPVRPGARPFVPSSAAIGTGQVRVAVQWPERRTQAIPYSTSVLDVMLSSGSTVVASASIPRPEAGVTLVGLAPGTYTLAATARRPSSVPVAAGTTSVTVVSNRLAQARLVLTPTTGPHLEYLYPTAGLPGTAITLYGSNLLPPAGGTFSVTVDGRAVPGASLQPPSGNYVVLTDLPSWAGATCSIGLSVDGIAAPVTEARIYTRNTLDHVKLEPAAVSLATGSSQAFTATAYQDVAGTMPLPGQSVLWTLMDVVPGPEVGQLLGGGVFQAGEATGSATLRIEIGGHVATASIRVGED